MQVEDTQVVEGSRLGMREKPQGLRVRLVLGFVGPPSKPELLGPKVR